MKRYFRPANIIAAALLGFVSGSICRLGMVFGSILALVIFLFLPSFQKYIRKEKEAYFRYTQACLYMEQMENSFKKNRRIYPSLKETFALFPEGEMKDVIGKAVAEIEKEDAAADAAEKALAMIEGSYGCEQMELMHAFFLRSQEQGGDFSQAVRVLESRRDAWMKSVEECRAQKKNMLISVMLSFLLLFAVSEAMMFFLPEEMNVMEDTFERAAAVTEVTLLLFMARTVLKKNAADWLEPIKERSPEAVLKDYRFVEGYQPAREMRASFKWAAIPAVITVFFILGGKSAAAVSVMLALTVLLLNQHKMDYAMRKKRIKKETERDFPRWMFHVILLLRTESVQGAVYASADKAPASLQYPVERMCEKLKQDPTGPDPYFSFLEGYDVPKIQEAVKLLYSISSGTGGSIDEQMMSVIDKNNAMTLQSEKMKNDDKVAGLMGYLFLPAVPAGLKMMMDMVLVLLAIYGSMGDIL